MTANPRASKARGYKWEADLRSYFRAEFPEYAEAIERNGTTYGRNDRGDLRGIPSWTIEAKDEQRINLPGYLAELAVEQVNNETPHGLVIVKARRKAVGQAYAVMTLDEAVKVIRQTQETNN